MNFAIPNTSIEDKACLQYEMIDPEGACTQDNFNMDKLITCNKHIYSPDVQYEFSLIEDYDIPPCPNENWALEVILNEFMYSNISKVGSTSNLIFKPTVSQKDFINMGYMLGMVIGSFVFGLMSDHFGRKMAKFPHCEVSTVKIPIRLPRPV